MDWIFFFIYVWVCCLWFVKNCNFIFLKLFLIVYDERCKKVFKRELRRIRKENEKSLEIRER